MLNKGRIFPLMLIVFSVIGLGYPFTQTAMAFPDPIHSVFEDLIFSEETVILTIEASDPSLNHTGQSIRVWDPLNMPSFDDMCPLENESNGGMVWELRDDSNPTKVVSYNLPNVGDKIQVEFGAGETISIIPSGGATVDGSASSKDVRWVEINDGFFGQSDSTFWGGDYRFTSCGTMNGDGTFGNEGVTFTVINLVAGIEIPINSISLLLAGFSTNYVLILPTMAGIFGTLFALMKFKNKKTN